MPPTTHDPASERRQAGTMCGRSGPALPASRGATRPLRRSPPLLLALLLLSWPPAEGVEALQRRRMLQELVDARSPPLPALLPLDSLVARLDLGAWADGSNLTRGAPAYVWAYASGDSASWPVCPPGWDDAAADLVCRLNGVGGGRAVDARSLPNPTRIPIGYPFPKDKIGLVECAPGASSLADCRGAFIRKGNCKAIAMVSCGGSGPPPMAPPALTAPARPPPGAGPGYGGGSGGGPPPYGSYGGGPPRGGRQ